MGNTESNYSAGEWKQMLSDDDIGKLVQIRHDQKGYHMLLIIVHGLIEPEFFKEHEDKLTVQLHLGDFYYHTRKLQEARKWYILAAKQDNRVAQNALFVCLANMVVPQEKTATVHDYCQALSLMVIMQIKEKMSHFDELTQHLENCCKENNINGDNVYDEKSQDILGDSAKAFFEK